MGLFPTWTTANRTVVRPLPASPFSPDDDDEHIASIASGTRKLRRKREDSECVSPRTKKPRRRVSAFDTSSDSEGDDVTVDIHARGDARATVRRVVSTLQNVAAVREAGERSGNATVGEEADDGGEEDGDVTAVEEDAEERGKEESEKAEETEGQRAGQRRQGRFYADEFGAAQALLGMSRMCWGE